MSAPKEIHCLACRTKQPINDPKKVEITFESKKKKIPMKRTVWEGTCGKCGKPVKQFAGGGAEKAPREKSDGDGEWKWVPS